MWIVEAVLVLNLESYIFLSIKTLWVLKIKIYKHRKEALKSWSMPLLTTKINKNSKLGWSVWDRLYLYVQNCKN